MDKRIGIIKEDSVTWPETTISGVAPYGRPATMLFLGTNLFAVVDTFIDNQKLATLTLELQKSLDKSDNTKK